MTTRRQEKYASAIQRELGLIFLKDTKRFFGDALISVTRVTVSPDLSFVKVYVNFVNVQDTENMITKIQEHTNEVKWILGNKIRKHVRKVPDLAFYYDDTLDYMEKLDKIFDQINKKDTEEE